MVNTVLGQISETELGATLCHEHIFVGSGDMARAFGERYYDKEKLVELAVRQIIEAKEKHNLTTIIDGTPIDTGRDVDLLVRVSQKSGVHIIASTGLYYDERSFMYGKNPFELANMFIHECKYGMENTYKTSSPVKPGMLKCATDSLGVTEVNRIILTAMARTQRETSLPLFAHNNHLAKTALKQLHVLEKEGADLSKVIVGHISDTTDVEYIAEVLKQNVYIGFDRINCSEKQVEVLCEMLDRGFVDKILLSSDGGTFIDFGGNTFEKVCESEENSFLTVLGKFIPMLEEKGVSKIEIDKMMKHNLHDIYVKEEL